MTLLTKLPFHQSPLEVSFTQRVLDPTSTASHSVGLGERQRLCFSSNALPLVCESQGQRTQLLGSSHGSVMQFQEESLNTVTWIAFLLEETLERFPGVIRCSEPEGTHISSSYIELTRNITRNHPIQGSVWRGSTCDPSMY